LAFIEKQGIFKRPLFKNTYFKNKKAPLSNKGTYQRGSTQFDSRT